MATPRAAEHRDLERRLRDIETALRNLATVASQRPQFEVSAGDLTINGGDLVVDGGDFLLLDTDGSTVFRLGPQPHGDRGVAIYREDGSPAVVVARPGVGFDQGLSLHDAAGNVLLREASLASGIDAPFFDIPLQPYRATAGTVNAGPHGFESDTTSGAFETMHVASFARQNHLTRWWFQVSCSDATTAAEVRVLGNGSQLTQYAGAAWTGTRAAGAAGYQEVASPRLVLPGAVHSSVSVEVQARRTAGAGTVSVAVTQARGSIL